MKSIRGCPGPFLSVILLSFLLVPFALHAQDGDGEASGVEALPGFFPETIAETTKVWGAAGYSLGAEDIVGFSSLSDWTAGQSAYLSLNLSSPSGLEIISDFTVYLDGARENDFDSVIQQLSIRFAPCDWLSMVVGKQRLKWGTGNVFAAIDKGEERGNPLSTRTVMNGLSGIKAEIIPTDWIGFSLLIIPDVDLRWSGGAVRADITLADLGLDIGFGAIKYAYYAWNPGLSLSGGGAISGISDIYFDKLDRAAFIADTAWGSGDITLYGEAQVRWGRESGYWMPGMAAAEDFSAASRDEAVFRGLAGMMLQIDLGLTRAVSLVAEYFYQGDGLTSVESDAFRGHFRDWLGGPSASSAGVLPPVFGGIGAFRRHYGGISVNSIAIDRYLLANASVVAGLDSGLVMARMGLGFDLPKGTGISLSWNILTSLLPESEEATELMLIPYRNSVTLSVSTGF